jgi:hypothetical protein
MKLFDGLMAFVEQLPKALENLGSAIRSAKKSDPHHGDVDPLRVQAQIRFADADVAEHRANQQEQTSIQRSIKRAAWSAFFAAFAYAGISLCQWHETQKQTIIQRNVSIVAQRAWLATSISEITYPEAAVRGLHKITLSMETKNIGATPAKRVLTVARVILVKRGQKLTFDYDRLPATDNAQALILPKRNFKFDAPLREDHAMAPAVLSAIEWDKFQNGDFWLIVYGTTTYVDTFEKWHWQRFCEWSSPSPTDVGPLDCTAYNDMDKTDLDDDGKDPHEPKGMGHIGPKGLPDIEY